MTGPPIALAFSIEGRVDETGRLLSADPHLLRLHQNNGGDEKGVLAVPALLTVAQLCWRTGSKIERPVRAADGERDVDLWVKARRVGDEVQLSISGWQEHVADPRPATIVWDSASPQSQGSSRAGMILDARHNVLHVAPVLIETVGALPIGRPFEDCFVPLGDAGHWPWEQVDRPVAMHLRGNGARFHVTASCRLWPDGAIKGFDLKLEPEDDAMRSDSTAQAVAPTGFGRHLATAVRQPLQRIIANAETIRASRGPGLQDNYLAYARDIAAAASHLNELIADLEDLEAIDREDFKVATERVELGDIARRVAGLLALKAADHHIRLMLPDSDLAVEVCGEFRRALQITLNLVSNAIRYAPDGSAVRIRIDSEPPALHVADEGGGIAPEDRERVFEKFERLGRSGSGGSGLGLYISRRLARAMKGDLTVGDAPEGGAMFTLRLPPWSGA